MPDPGCKFHFDEESIPNNWQAIARFCGTCNSAKKFVVSAYAEAPDGTRRPMLASTWICFRCVHAAQAAISLAKRIRK